MNSRYDVEITSDYLDNCTVDHKRGMFPTFEMLNEYSKIHEVRGVMPTRETSTLMTRLANLFEVSPGDEFLYQRFRDMCDYRNCCLPLSNKYKNLDDIITALRFRWIHHDVVNYNKFDRIAELEIRNNFDPYFNIEEYWNKEATETPNETTQTTGDSSVNISAAGTSETNSENTETAAATINGQTRETETATKTGTETTAKTGTETANITDTTTHTGTENREIKRNGSDTETGTKTETHSGSDIVTTTNTKQIAENNTTGVTSFDQTANFINDETEDHNNTTTDNGSETTQHGHVVTTSSSNQIQHNTTDTDKLTLNTSDSKTATDQTTYNVTDQTTYNTTDQKQTTGETETTDTHNSSGTGKSKTEDTKTETRTGSHGETKTRTGRNTEETKTTHKMNNGLSLAEIEERERAFINVFDIYLISVMDEIALYELEDIW